MAPRFKRDTRAQVQGPGAVREEAAETDRLFGLSGSLPRLVEADVARIAPNPDQPRTVFDEADLRALAASIERHGLQQPILVTAGGGPGEYRLVAGERRLRAHQMLGRATIPAIITQGRPEEIALIENVQRVDLDAVDLARSLERLMERHGFLMAEVGVMIGCVEAEVSRRLSVLRLPDDVLEDYRRDPARVSRSVLVEIATLDDPALVRSFWQRAKAGMTVRDLRVEKKAARASAPRPLTARAMGQSLARIAGELDRLQEARGRLPEEHRDRLRAMRDRIDSLLGG